MTPKEQFRLDTERMRRHQAIVDQPELKANLLVAFNEFCWSRLPASESPERSWAANAMREGAQKFIDTFLTLADQPATRKNPHAAGQLEDQDADYRTRHARKDGPVNPG